MTDGGPWADVRHGGRRELEKGKSRCMWVQPLPHSTAHTRSPKGHLGRKGRDNLAQLRAQPDQGEGPPAQFQEGRNQTWLGGGGQVMEVLGGTPLDQPGEWDQAGL